VPGGRLRLTRVTRITQIRLTLHPCAQITLRGCAMRIPATPACLLACGTPAAGGGSVLFLVFNRERIPGYRLFRRQPAPDEPVEPGRERRRIARQLAVEDQRLLEQQRRKIGDVAVAVAGLGLGERLHQRVTHIELEDRLAAGAAVVTREQAVE